MICYLVHHYKLCNKRWQSSISSNVYVITNIINEKGMELSNITYRLCDLVFTNNKYMLSYDVMYFVVFNIFILNDLFIVECHFDIIQCWILYMYETFRANYWWYKNHELKTSWDWMKMALILWRTIWNTYFWFLYIGQISLQIHFQESN